MVECVYLLIYKVNSVGSKDVFPIMLPAILTVFHVIILHFSVTQNQGLNQLACEQ